MNIAVLTLTRDRLEYTRHCFESLRNNAGCDYDHYVLDQGSTDGTREWLGNQWCDERVRLLRENIGISRGMNMLLDQLDDYDVIVKFDNDCELLTPGTLSDVAALVVEHQWLLSPAIHGLRFPPATIATESLGGTLVDEKRQIGGIFLAAPASLYSQFRYSETNPSWGGDDGQVCAWWRSRGGRCGYLQGCDANHYETTDGQHGRFPEYFDRVRREGKTAA